MRFLAAVVALFLCAHAGLWALLREQGSAPGVAHDLMSVSYAPLGDTAKEPISDDAARARIDADLSVLASVARSVRTYTATGGAEHVAPIANGHGLKVTAGAWIGKDEEQNEREIASVLEIAKRNSNVNAVLVGNEAIFRDDQSVSDLVQKIRRVKSATKLPVSTGEIWHIWLEHPELASTADFIAAHILPYWEGFPASMAVDQAVLIYNRLRAAYPGKRIVIAEFGWPSQGLNRDEAVPGRVEQAEVLRSFVSRANALGMDYNIIEAIDQPWKTFEGSVGAYWGIFDTGLKPKFDWGGPVLKADHWQVGALALLVGLLLSLPILGLREASLGQASFLALAANAVGAWVALVAAYWQDHYFTAGSVIAFLIAVVLLVPLIMIALARISEIAAVAFGRAPRRLIDAPVRVPGYRPKVSIHIPAHREPAHMLMRTLDSVAKLDYDNFECLVVINNTPEPEFWRPVEAHCRALGSRFKFLNLENVKGFKAGALRRALEHTAADAEIIGVLDADYTVDPSWLGDLVPVFADEHVGIVQAPQDHRDGHRSPLHEMMNDEYAGFFDIGMVQRNEANAIIVHGTMCLIRRAALDDAGGWSSDTICEDSDLGLAMLERGWQLHYTRRRYGQGLLPDTFDAFRKQRHRWAYGGWQILKKHWQSLIPSSSALTSDQRREFAVGWLAWLGAESLGVAVAVLNLASIPFILSSWVAIPDRILTLPIVASFAVSLLHFLSLYRLRCAVPVRGLPGAVLAAMSVQWTIAQAVGTALVKDHLPFKVTAKGGARRRGRQFAARTEALLAVALVASAAYLVGTNWHAVREINIFAGVLVLQSLPFIAAAVLAWFEGSAMNSFAFWRLWRGRLSRALERWPLPVRSLVAAGSRGGRARG